MPYSILSLRLARGSLFSLISLSLFVVFSHSQAELPPPPPLPLDVGATEPLPALPASPPVEIVDSLVVPEGFEVTLYADDDLAHDIYSMTIDSRGRVVVAGAGYVRILHDRDGNGAADDYTEFNVNFPVRIDGKAFNSRLSDAMAEGGGKMLVGDMANAKVQVYGDVAILSYNFIGVAQNAEGETSPWLAKSTRVYVKQGGEWKLVHANFAPVSTDD